MNASKRRTILAVILAMTIILGLVGTFAYFTTQGNSVKQNLTIETGTLALTFEDNTDGFDAELNLGESKSKEFIIRNTGTQPVTTKMYWKNLTNTYMKESLSYKLEYKTSEEGAWQDITTVTNTNVPRALSTSTKELANSLTIPVGGVYYYKLTIKLENLENINQAQDVRAKMTSQFTIGNENVTISTPIDATLENLNILSNGTKSSFATIATTNEGVFEMADDYGTSYYYRGAVDNNYVKFGGFYWRIIRVNGDGSIRMIYDGTQAYANANGGDGEGGTDRFVKTGQVFNENSNDAKYVGYMYGPSGTTASISLEQAQTNTTNSDIKTYLEDTWYTNNIAKNAANGDADLSGYLGDEIFCNDRSTASDSQTWWTSDTKLGYGTNATAYGASSRFATTSTGWNTNPSPKFTCSQKNDAFTVDDTTKGNGFLTKKIGLITADEIVAAGTYGGATNKSYYLFKNSSYWYWLLSPYVMYINGNVNVFVVSMSGALDSWIVGNTYSGGAVAPVINLSADAAATLTGSGTTSSPYQVPGVA